METKKVYQYDEKNYFKGELTLDSSDKSPSGSWNIPARCVEIEPPAEKDGYKRKWSGSGWEYEEIPKEPEPPEPTLEELKALKVREAGAEFAKRRDKIRFVDLPSGNTYGFDCANEDITNFMARYTPLMVKGSGAAEYKVWLNETEKGLVMLDYKDYEKAYDVISKDQITAYAWYEGIKAQIEEVQSKEDLEKITFE